MRVGSVCYATERGLGRLCREFFLHGVVTDVFVVVHPGVPTREDWYPDAPTTRLRNFEAGPAKDFCNNMDAMLFFETPFDWSLIIWCEKQGIPTYIVTMYECTPEHRPHPTRYICPSLLDVECFNRHPHVFLPLPVEYPWRLRERALEFVHNGGYLGLRGKDGVHREGTETVIEAWQHVRSPAKLTVRVQENVGQRWIDMCRADPRITYLPETVPYEELYAVGDVAVGAQKWNGCSLPLQEARASGMLVMNTDRFPMNTWLPTRVPTPEHSERPGEPPEGCVLNPLVPVKGTVSNRLAGRFLEIDEAVVDTKDLAAKVDEWYGADISDYSRSALEWAEGMSWAALKPRWLEVLGS